VLIFTIYDLESKERKKSPRSREKGPGRLPAALPDMLPDVLKIDYSKDFGSICVIYIKKKKKKRP
jgi:hypothetical protein